MFIQAFDTTALVEYKSLPVGAAVAAHWRVRLFENVRFFGQIAQSVEQGIENPRVGGSIPSLATFSLLCATVAGCSPDPCTELCNDTTEALAVCMPDWSMEWQDFDAADQEDFQERCITRWGEVRSNLVAREIEDARGQCREGRKALEDAQAVGDDCDLLRASYLD